MPEMERAKEEEEKYEMENYFIFVVILHLKMQGTNKTQGYNIQIGSK